MLQLRSHAEAAEHWLRTVTPTIWSSGTCWPHCCQNFHPGIALMAAWMPSLLNKPSWFLNWANCYMAFAWSSTSGTSFSRMFKKPLHHFCILVLSIFCWLELRLQNKPSQVHIWMQVFPALAPKPVDLLILDNRKLHPRMLLARSLLERP